MGGSRTSASTWCSMELCGRIGRRKASLVSSRDMAAQCNDFNVADFVSPYHLDDALRHFSCFFSSPTFSRAAVIQDLVGVQTQLFDQCLVEALVVGSLSEEGTVHLLSSLLRPLRIN